MAGHLDDLQSCLAHNVALRFFNLDQKTLEFGCVRVGINHSRSKAVKDRSRIPARVFLNSAVTLMNRYADLVDLLAIDHHRFDAFGDKGFCDVIAARARYLDLVVSL